MDNSIVGVNKIICDKLKLNKTRILIPKKGTIKKLTTYVPEKNLEDLKNNIIKSKKNNNIDIFNKLQSEFIDIYIRNKIKIIQLLNKLKEYSNDLLFDKHGV
jgi:hypothetical protein